MASEPSFPKGHSGRRRRWPWVIAGVAGVVAVAGIIGSTAESQPPRSCLSALESEGELYDEIVISTELSSDALGRSDLDRAQHWFEAAKDEKSQLDRLRAVTDSACVDVSADWKSAIRDARSPFDKAWAEALRRCRQLETAIDFKC